MVSDPAAEHLRRMRDHNTTLRTLLDINGVISYAETGNQFEVGCLVQEPSVYGLGSNEYCHNAFQLVIIRSPDLFHVSVLLEGIRDVLRDVLGIGADQNFRSHVNRVVRVG